jgi:hypothetical protein
MGYFVYGLALDALVVKMKRCRLKELSIDNSFSSRDASVGRYLLNV